MRKTATMMLVLGVAVLTLFGAALTIKNSYAKAEVSRENLMEINAQVEAWFSQSRDLLEEAGVPHSDSEEALASGSTAALGESVQVGGGFSPAPVIMVVLGIAGGLSMLFVAFDRQYRTAPQAASVSEAVDQIVAKSASRQTKKTPKARQSRRAQKGTHDEFEDISRAVDEIVAKYQRED